MHPPVPEALRRWADERPDAEAVVCGDRRLTWRELDAQATALASWLVSAGVKPGDRVGLHLRKSVELVVAVHGVWRARAGFVPIDPAAPAARVGAIVDDADPAALVTDADGLAKLADSPDLAPTVFVDAASSDGEYDAGHRAVPWPEALATTAVDLTPVELDDLAYLMYTSGSTGVPKGMIHTHRTSLGFAGWGVAQCDLVPEDRVANFSPLHFDISVFDWFSSALAGSTLVLVPEPVLAFPASTLRLLDVEGVTIVFTVPFALSRLAATGLIGDHDLGGLRWVLFGGEPYQPSQLADLMRQLPHARYANVYGPAEAPACVVHEVSTPPGDERPVPIGRLAADTTSLVVEAGTLQPVTVGEPGELLIAAPSITLGYWNRPELNERTSVDHDGRRWFRTGDIVRVGLDGVFDFLGRNDRMVKTRGYRVELDEVEAALASHPLVGDAAAFATTVDGVTLVHAAVVPAGAEPVTDAAIYGHLRDRLPSYALPVDVAVMDDFPRTTSDKIDRRALGSRAEAART